MQGKDPIIDYRIRVVTTGLIVSWFGLIVFAIWSLTVDEVSGVYLWTFLGGLLVALVLITLTPWRSMLESGVGDWVLLVWSLAILAAVIVFETARNDEVASGIGFLLVTFFAAATLMPNASLLAVGIASTAAYGASLFATSSIADVPVAGTLLAYLAAVVFVLLISIGIRTQLERTNRAYTELVAQGAALERREREISQLYDVSRTIGAGTKLDEVLPELVGRIAQSVGARVGLVLLYDPETEHLDLMSPIWAAGHTVHADPLSLSLDEPGVAPRVFMTGDPAVMNDESATSADRLASQLAADRVASVAMRVEDRTIGVLLVGDKESEFTEDDLRTLESVAAPAALVLNQMARYEAARTTGERMAELAELKTDFVSVVSHELRTPLTSIIGALSTLKRPELSPSDPRAVELVEMAAKQSQRLKTLIEDLLVISRIEAQSLPMRPETIDLTTFLGELLESIPGGDRLVHDRSATLPSVIADPDHLTRVMTNLIDNAIKYGGEKDVAISVGQVGNRVHIAVIDHGPGVPYEQRDRMFERFTQLQPHATRSRGGAGLGLSIVKGLVEAMDGRVWFEPTVGGGATFTVAIPAA